ncbi:MAG: M28 family peptidase [Gemmatimonadota bacterium]
MSGSTSVRVGLTLAWAAALVGFLRFWELTNLVPPLAGWACVYLVGYAATVAVFEGPAALRRRAEVGRLAVWAGLIVAVLVGTLLVPTVQARAAIVRTTLFVRVIDTVVPLWVTARAGVLLWKGATRVLVLGGFAATFLLALWGLMARMPGQSFRGAPPALTAAQQEVRAQLAADVRALATDIGPRHYRQPAALADAAAYIERAFRAAGREVASQPFVVSGQSFRNLEVVIPGTVRPAEIVVVGAHYDTAEGTPGADDNASGVAVLLALARAWQGMAFARTVKLVAFANEEPPFFDTDGMGSRIYAARAAERGERIVGMVSRSRPSATSATSRAARRIRRRSASSIRAWGTSSGSSATSRPGRW